MVGVDDDLMLRLTPDNCPAFKDGLSEYNSVLQTYIHTYKTSFFPRLASLFGYTAVTLTDALEMCQYLEWADLHNVELDINFK